MEEEMQQVDDNGIHEKVELINGSNVSRHYKDLKLLTNLTLELTKLQVLHDIGEDEIYSVVISKCEMFERGFFKQPYYTNICGCIKHWDVKEIYKKAVMPYVHSVQNGFGKFYCISSVECNLLSSSSVVKNSTLFRGGRNSKRIIKVFDNALHKDTISSITVHMLVCSGNVGEMIHTKNTKLKQKLTWDNRWSVESMITSQENSFSMNFKLEKFDENWIRSLSGNFYVETPKRLLLTVSRVGSVNMFLTLDSARFFENIEEAYLPIFQTIFDITRRCI